MKVLPFPQLVLTQCRSQCGGLLGGYWDVTLAILHKILQTFLYDYQIKARLLISKILQGSLLAKPCDIPTRVSNPTDHQFWLCISTYMGLHMLNYIQQT